MAALRPVTTPVADTFEKAVQLTYKDLEELSLKGLQEVCIILKQKTYGAKGLLKKRIKKEQDRWKGEMKLNLEFNENSDGNLDSNKEVTDMYILLSGRKQISSRLVMRRRFLIQAVNQF